MEMLVTITLISLVMGGVVLFFIRIFPLQKFAMESSQAQLAASQSVTSIVSLLRNMRQSDSGEYALHGAGSDEIIFFADEDSDGAVERVRIFLDGNDIRKGVVQPVGTPAAYSIDQEVISIIVTYVRNGTGSYPSDIFFYYDEGNQLLSGNFSLGEVRMVKVDVYIDVQPSSSPSASHFESFASIRNLSEYDRLQ